MGNDGEADKVKSEKSKVKSKVFYLCHFSPHNSPENNKPRHTEEAHGSVYQAVIRSLRRRGYLPLRYPSRAVLSQYQHGRYTKVDCHRIA